MPAYRARSRIALGLTLGFLLLPANVLSQEDPAGDTVPGRIVVRYASPGAAIDALSAWGAIALQSEGLGFVVLEVPERRVGEAIAALRAQPGVLDAYPERYATQQALDVGDQRLPNDALLGSQWGAFAIGMPRAWALGVGSHAATVAVLDGAASQTHPDLAGNTPSGDAACPANYDTFTRNTTLGVADRHGTHVSGTVAAVSDNALGVAGMAQACLMSVNVCFPNGGCPWTNIAAGIEWAVQNGADVISMSLSGTWPDPVVAAAVEDAEAAGVLIVAAAGNLGCEVEVSRASGEFPVRIDEATIKGYPAAFPGVVAVAALSSPTEPASFSSCFDDVEIAAPGDNIVSTSALAGVNVASTIALAGVDAYEAMSGTSMATPHVSGVAALLKSLNPALDGDDLRCLLTATADDLGPQGQDPYTGFGRLDAAEAAEVAAGLRPFPSSCDPPQGGPQNSRGALRSAQAMMDDWPPR